jgi:integrase
MPKFPKPFFRSGRGWYIQLGKEQIKLADGPQNAGTEAAAFHRYHELMAERGRVQPGSPPVAEPSLTVAEMFEKYLDWCEKHRAPRTYEWYRDHVQSFISHHKGTAADMASLPVPALKAFHVVEWADAHAESWSPAYRRGAIVAIQRPFNFAEELGYITATPIKKIKKPQPQRREQAIDPTTWATIRDHYAEGDCFRDLLEVAWESGCRPQEVKRIEARHVDLAARKVVFPPNEAKGKKRMRVIYLTPRAEEIIRRRLRKDGILFRNEDDRPWTNQAVSLRFSRLRKHVGGVKFACYSIRHGFGTRKLVEGHDAITIAQIMGHRDARMLSTVYQHLDQNEDHLRKALNSNVEVAKAS